MSRREVGLDPNAGKSAGMVEIKGFNTATGTQTGDHAATKGNAKTKT